MRLSPSVVLLLSLLLTSVSASAVTGLGTGSRVAPAAGTAQATEIEVHFIDVGQGDSTLVKCPNGNKILVDAGQLPNPFPVPVREYLLEQLGSQTPRIDDLVITHPDEDHYNMLADVLNGVDVEHVWMVGDNSDYSSSFRGWLNGFGASRKTNLPVDYHDPVNTPNAALDCGDASVWVLAANVQASASATNAKSIVLMISYGDFDVVLTGDATTATEGKIMGWYDHAWLESEVLKIGHHGSSTTSTSDDWAKIIRPQVAVASAGYENGYGHPRREVIQRLDDFTVAEPAHMFRWGWWDNRSVLADVTNYREAIFNTGASGTVVLKSNGSSYRVLYEGSPLWNEESGATSISTPIVSVGVELEINLQTEEARLTNTTSAAISLNGWTLVSTVGNQRFSFTNFDLAAGASVIVTAGPNARDAPPDFLRWTASYIWRNAGDDGELYNSAGQLVAREAG